MTLKQQVANLMNEGFTARQIYDRLKPMHPNTTIGSIAFNVSLIKRRNAEKATNEQTQTQQS